LGLPCGQRYWRSRQSEHNDCREHNAQMLGSYYWFFHYSSPRFDDRDLIAVDRAVERTGPHSLKQIHQLAVLAQLF
jgi:hypothetical protein